MTNSDYVLFEKAQFYWLEGLVGLYFLVNLFDV
ncbi:hypothetical protein swp_0642 [Shewanella piezotolerans WP3]|uniref:Uncharacterized protein n=1 Tax=Shewanella piezotolerans (strain WP3 / JCM 13877) TaxID=225849 RepID=B8CII5_SHEPW|nr:hypothetical protein swp_0642 [Shewanella piezotolerans WP3]